ncbi:heterotrimeric G-protein alpha subunit (G-alpha, GPA2) [Hesseltinella vesiculosa]|uniref:Heterotrimeric G-protein alpha subunit (G-alpha, GPA2) n=1 Tax=Hesseltinella vesiculosa TaxID=101127 RepID=A0A1X2GHG4_9FUNG|nr:heterotrimeric G-protein alpha subunit (G-alpha, GPA2) [Hesseltinella vesiculosa]
MGNQVSTNTKQEKLFKTSKAIDRQIRLDEERKKSEIKLLLLGTKEAGKSTFFKQLQFSYGSHQLTANDRLEYRSAIFQNIYTSMQFLIQTLDQFQIPLEYQDLQTDASLFSEPFETLGPSFYFNPLYLHPLEQLWADAGIQKAHRLAGDDGLPYFFDKLQTIWAPGYIPNNQDILCCKEQAQAMNMCKFKIGPYKYKIIDIAGEKIMADDSKKWLHCFDDISAVLFLVSINGYDKGTLYDPNSNQMRESLILFDAICNSPWFKSTTIIVLLNKMDLFLRKIKHSRVTKYFGDYDGDEANEEQVIAYFKQRFQSLNRNPQRHIFCDYTNALDGQLIRQVTMTVFNVIGHNLDASSLL